MAKKIHVIELKEVEIVQVEGTEEFTEVVRNKRKYPVFLTNFALSRGYDTGILDSSLISELLKIKKSLNGSYTKEEQAESVVGHMDENKMMDVIYLAFVGANPKTDITKDDFLMQYHADFTEKMKLYFEIVSAVVNTNTNAFAKGLDQSTAAKEKKLESQS